MNAGSLRRQPSRLTTACALLAAGLVLLLAVLAVCPEAHEWLHKDADRGDHECAVTLFMHGVAPTVTGIAVAVVAWAFTGVVSGPAVEASFAASEHLLLPGRAPPVC